MIGDIRNPWIRRPLLVVVVPFAAILDATFAMAVSVRDSCSMFADVWRGPDRG